MSWYKLNCGDPLLSDPVVTGVIEAFEQYRRDGQIGTGASIYSRHESRNSLHCELILYFTPETAPVARRVGARPCPVPRRRGLAPLAEAGERKLPK